MTTAQIIQSTSETMMYTYYLGYNEVSTADRKVADFYEYCISRRGNGKTEFKWDGDTKGMLNDIELYCQKKGLSLTMEEVAYGLHCFDARYGYNEDYDTITKNKYEHWAKIGKEWTDDFPQE